MQFIFSVRDENIIKKLAAYVILGIGLDEIKEVISLSVEQNESSKFWLGTLNDLKNRGVKDIMVLCADGLSGIKEAINATFPENEYQRCIVHQVRNTLKHVPHKDMKIFTTDLKTIYQAPTGKNGYERIIKVTEKCMPIYPNSMKSWKVNWDAINPIFNFSARFREVIYTTNAIESLNRRSEDKMYGEKEIAESLKCNFHFCASKLNLLNTNKSCYFYSFCLLILYILFCQWMKSG